MAIEVKAWVGNLGKYNEGELVGEWVTFPIDDDDWEEVMERIGIDYEKYEETFCADYDSELKLFDMFGEYPQCEQLNELADCLDSVDDEDVFLAILNDYATDVWQALDVYAKGEYRYWEGCQDMSDVAYRICQDDPRFCDAPRFMKNHFSYKSYGEELDSCGTFIPCGTGYLEIY